MARTGLWLVLLLQTLISQTGPDFATGSIEGVVTNILTKEPVEGVRLRLAPRGNRPLQDDDAELQTVLTDKAGRFSFTRLAPSAYTMVIDGNGFVRQQVGQKTFPGSGTPVDLAAGQALRGLTISLTPTATVSGRIRDHESGLPVAGVPVQLLRDQYNFEGRRTQTVAASVETNDRGEYRLYFLTPGRYYLRAGGPAVRTRPASVPGNPNQRRAEYSVMFYPLATSPGDAARIDVKPAADLGGMDLAVAKRALYRISGRVVDAVSGQPPVAATLSLYGSNDGQWQQLSNARSNYRAADGGFQFSDIPPGSYRIVVQARRTPQRFADAFGEREGVRVVNVAFRAAPQREDPPGYAAAHALVDIAAADVEGVVVAVSSGLSVSGRLRLEGGAPPATGWDRLQAELRSPDGVVSAFAPVAAPDASGLALFSFSNLAPGQYRFSMRPPAGVFVKEADFGGLNALDSNIEISDRNLNSLEIFISINVAALSGTVRNARGESVANSVVVLVPEQRDRIDLFQRVAAGADGGFSLLNVAPGNYTAIAWEALEPYAHFDPELLRAAASRGAAIRVAELSTQQLDLTAVPVD